MMTISSCGGGSDFDDGSRPGEARRETPAALEKELRAVRPELREGVQRAIACERDRIRASGGTYRIDTRRIRDMTRRYEADRSVADC
jgi:hypothetical protein